MKIKWVFLLILASVYGTTVASILSQEQLKIAEDALKKVIPQINISEAKIELIQPDLYKIIANAEIFYVSKDGKYFFHGDLIDLTEKNTKNWNITEVAQRTVRKAELGKFLKKDMLIFKQKHRHHRQHHKHKPIGIATVFADISCPYSRRLHKEVEEAVAAGLEVRYLFFPRAGVGSDSYKKAVSIWCGKDRNKEFSMANNDEAEAIPDRTCRDNPIEDQFNFARKIGVNATPTILLENGTIIPGYVTADKLLSLVREANASSGS
ncbi:MAG: DsbC family protein [Gammaproteobacteria bacterium]|jgi:thiol:disulfide interchange protein DsbC